MSDQDKEKQKQYFKAYHKTYSKTYYQLKKNDPDYIKLHKKCLQRSREKHRTISETAKLLRAFRSKGCGFCPETDTCCLTAHHIDPALKSFGISQGISSRRSFEEMQQELAKCICVCHNCHAKIHAKKIVVPS